MTEPKNFRIKPSAFLKKIKTDNISSKEIEDLRKVLRFHEHRYYIQNDPLISDFEYDSLYKQLGSV